MVNENLLMGYNGKICNLPTLAIGVIGNTADSDSVVLGSSPRSPAIKRSELFMFIGWLCMDLHIARMMVRPF